jgi:ABC-type siderophore export system fused ATPase/permease subunit
MTEVLLNLLWLLIAAAMVVTWRLRWVHQRRVAPRNARQEAIALVCSLVLLFFVVSLSDDLREEVLVCDVCSASRKQTSRVVSAHPLNQLEKAPATPGWAVLPRVEAPAPRLMSEGITLEAEAPAATVGRSLTSGRAPPASVL